LKRKPKAKTVTKISNRIVLFFILYS
jgi:hypothetical protein